MIPTKREIKNLFICICIPLLIGGLSAYFTRDNMSLFENIKKPPLAPPAGLFPIVWTILYLLMGISLYLVYFKGKPGKNAGKAIIYFALQLFFNFFWAIIFFNLQWYFFAFIWLIVLWCLILKMILEFYPLNQNAAYLQIPYLVWVTFAGYLNLGIALLN